jgi:hypothetical protein
MFPAEFEPAFTASKLPQTHALDHAGPGSSNLIHNKPNTQKTYNIKILNLAFPERRPPWRWFVASSLLSCLQKRRKY